MLLSASAVTLPSTTIVVTTTDDTAVDDADISGPTVSLREAINYANVDDGSSDTIVFSPSLTASGPATFTLNGNELTVSNSMTITGPGASQLIIDGDNLSRIFAVQYTSFPVTISGLTLRNANGYEGGAILNYGTLTLSDNVITGNTAGYGGGGVLNSGTLTSSNNAYQGNSAPMNNVGGGGIYNEGFLTSTGDTFSANTSWFGGAISNFGTSSTTGDTFSGNISLTEGGGIYNWYVGSEISAGDTFTGNTAVYHGGGIYSIGELTSTNDIISGNTAGAGGGITNDTGYLVSINDTISGNTAEIGGGILNIQGTLKSTSDTISGNTATYNGGGIYNDSGTLTAISDTISDNTAVIGGAILNFQGTLNATSDTITGNTAANNGGGIYNDGGTLTSTSDTIVWNTATGDGGGIWNNGTLSFRNSIILGNIETYGSDIGGLPVVDGGGNITTGALSSVLQTVPGNLNKPLLRNNGGPTQTIGLVAGSPAISAAIALGQVKATGDDGHSELAVDDVTYVAVGDYLKIGTEIVRVGAVYPEDTGTAGTLIVSRAQFRTNKSTLNGLPILQAFDQRGYSRSINNSGSVEMLTPTVLVTPYHVAYDGNAHTATGTATGAGGVDLSSGLDLSGTTHTNQGNYTSDSWKFHDSSGTYMDVSGTVYDVIDGSLVASITVTPYNVTYDGNAHVATGTATGVGGIDLSAYLTLTATTHTNAGQYAGDVWTFHDPSGIYPDASGTVTDSIAKADAVIAITPYSVVFDGNAHSAQGSATGVGNANLNSSLMLAGTTHTNPGIYNGDAWSFHDNAGNFSDASGTVNDLISTVPLIATQPASATVTAGATASFTATADGTPSPTVHWEVSTDHGTTWNDVPGATSTTYSLTTVAGNQGNMYRAVFKNVAGIVTTNPAMLTVNSAPVVTTHPSDVAVLAGATVNATAAATGFPIPAVQWQISADHGLTWNNIPGATSANISFTSIAAQDGYEARVVFTNAFGTATTNPATLSIISTPVVTTQPTNVTVVAGATVTFTAASVGSSTTTVQWQKSTDGGTTWTNITGATSTTYSFTSTAGQNGAKFHAVFSNAAGTATSNAATLTVNTVPVVTTQPTNQSVVAGATVSVTVAASGFPIPTVQWQLSTDGGATWSNIPGATSTTLSFVTVAAENGYKARAIFTNVAGSVTTNAVTLTVNSPPVVTTQPTNQTVAAGSTVTVTVAASGFPTASVQWQYSADGGVTWNNIAGATAYTLSFVASLSQNGLKARAVFTNAFGSVISNVVTLTVT